MTTHTKTPWFISDDSDVQIRANTKDGETTICEMWGTDSDAAFIVKAVNNHETLVEALTDCVCHLERLEYDAGQESDARINASKLLKNVRGEQ